MIYDKFNVIFLFYCISFSPLFFFLFLFTTISIFKVCLRKIHSRWIIKRVGVSFFFISFCLFLFL